MDRSTVFSQSRTGAHRSLLPTLVAVASLLMAASAAATITPPGGPRATLPATLQARAAKNLPVKPATVTLITGDRVVLDGAGRVSAIEPGPGRRSVLFVQSTRHGELSVVPTDAAPLLQRGVVDPRFFNVSLLAKFGYDDRHRNTLPAIARGIDAGQGAGRLGGIGMQGGRPLQAVRAFGGAVEKRRAGEFWAAVKERSVGVQRSDRFGPRVWLDGKRQVMLDRSVPQVGAPIAWEAGYTGRGITVAVLDSGIDATHPDFAGKIVAGANFSDEPDLQDMLGHGTHVASTIAGSGAASGGKFRGVAPDAQLAIGKVCTANGCPDSSILAGMQWATVTQHARIVNMSLGGSDSEGLDPIEEGIDNLSASTGALFVVAGGNDGCPVVGGTVGSPGTADAALSVAAIDRDGSIASFSSCGPRIGDGAVKPEISAPGVGIVAARSSTGQFPPTDSTGYYTTLSGTSMATPHVAGAAAIIAQQHPDFKGADIKALLVGTAVPSNATSPFQQGAGLVNVANAVSRSFFDTVANLSFGLQLWPHGDDPLLVKRITYRNPGAQAINLALSVHAATATGVAAPPGMFYLSATQLSIAPGGSADVDLTANTNNSAPDGNYVGEVVATSGTASDATLFSVAKEVQSYELALSHLDASGQPSNDYVTVIDRLDSVTPTQYFAPGSPTLDGKVTMRLPAGRYRIVTAYNSDHRSDLLVLPSLTLTGNQAVTVDGRRAGLWQFKLPDPKVLPYLRFVSFSSTHLPSGYSTLVGGIYDPAGTLYFGPIAAPGAQPDPNFSINFNGQYLQPDGSGGFDVTKPGFQISEIVSGKEAGLQKSYRYEDLARVTTQLPKTPPNVQINAGLLPYPAGHDFGLVQFLPSGPRNTTVSYVNSAPNLQWLPSVSAFSTSGTFEFLMLDSPWQAFAPGIAVTIDTAHPRPYGPSLNSNYDAFNYIAFPDMVPSSPAWRLAPVLRAGLPSGDDAFMISLEAFSDVHDQSGYLQSNNPYLGNLTLTKDGAVLFQDGVSFSTNTAIAIPHESGNYSLTVDYGTSDVIGPAFGLPTRNTTVWTFKSEAGRPDAWTQLPLSVMRLGKLQRDRNTLRLSFPLRVQRQATTDPVPDRVSSLSVELSSDGGSTWAPATLSGQGSDWSVSVPRAAIDSKSLSVRAKAVSADGSTVQQTLLGLYSPAAALSEELP